MFHEILNIFQVNLDVQQFKPGEIRVKIVDDCIVVDAKHEERRDNHGYISRQFTRRYKVPSDVDIDATKSKLSSDGILILEAPKKVSLLVCIATFQCAVLLFEREQKIINLYILLYGQYFTQNVFLLFL